MSAAAYKTTVKPEVNLDGIGNDLRAIPRWIHWRPRALGNGKVDKVPTHPATGENINHLDPANQKTFDDAVAALRPGLGLGIVLNGDGIIGADRDGCVGDDGTLTEDAAATVTAFGSYAEFSPSGRGIRILGRGVLPPEGRKRNGNEIYDGGRFLTITGNRVPGAPAIIAECQEAIDAFHAKYIARPEPAQSSAAPLPELNLDDKTVIENGRKMAGFGPLYDRGDLSAYGNDHSSADLGLLNYLVTAGATDAGQLDRIFRTSALMRNKWERDDYRQRTLARALDGTVAPYDWNQALTSTISRASRTLRPPEPTGQDDPSGTDPCIAEHDVIAALRAENAALRAENAELRAERDRLSRLQSATMTLFRSRELHAAEKVVGLVSLFEAEAAASREATDPDGWLDTPLERIADAAGCSAKIAGKHQAVIASTGLIEAQTISRRDPNTGAIKKHRQIRVPASAPEAPARSLPERIIALSTAAPERDPKKQRWGGVRTCPDCGDVGTVTITTVSCAGCGQVLTRDVTPLAAESPIGQLDPSKKRGSLPIGQLDPSGDPVPFAKDRRERRADRLTRREDADADLAARAEVQRAPQEAPSTCHNDETPQPLLFVPPDPPPPDRWTDVTLGGRP